MAKINSSAVSMILREIRAALEAKADEKFRLSVVALGKSPLKTLGVRPSVIRTVVRDVVAKSRGALDRPTSIALLDAAVARKCREEILVAIEILERFRRDFDASIFPHLERWGAVADDVEVAEALGARIAAPALAKEPSRMAMVKKWARLKSLGKRRFAVLAASGLVSDGRREAALVLDMCEHLLHEDHPILVSAVAGLLRDTTKVDAKAVQDFLFRRSIDGNPEILRAGSENLDAARRAALIAKLEAQSGVPTQLAAAEK